MLEAIVKRLWPPVPEKCVFCDSRLPLEPVGQHRFFCPGCGRDHEAVQDEQGDWKIDKRTRRERAREMLDSRSS